MGEGREDIVYIRLEEVAEGSAIDERRAGWVLGRVAITAACWWFERNCTAADHFV